MSIVWRKRASSSKRRARASHSAGASTGGVTAKPTSSSDVPIAVQSSAATRRAMAASGIRLLRRAGGVVGLDDVERSEAAQAILVDLDAQLRDGEPGVAPL